MRAVLRPLLAWAWLVLLGVGLLWQVAPATALWRAGSLTQPASAATRILGRPALIRNPQHMVGLHLVASSDLRSAPPQPAAPQARTASLWAAPLPAAAFVFVAWAIFIRRVRKPIMHVQCFEALAITGAVAVEDPPAASRDATDESDEMDQNSRQRRIARTVALNGCPEDITEDQLRQQFPSVLSIQLVLKWPKGPFSGLCFLQFPTVEEAEAVANTPGLQVAGQPVTSEMSEPYRQRYAREVRGRTVVLFSCPPATTPWELHQQFPRVKSVQMLPKGGPFSGKCLLVFPSAEEAEAVAATPFLLVLNTLVRAEMAAASPGEFQEATHGRTVILARCPAATTVSDLRWQFPNVAAVRLIRSGLHRKAFLLFPSRTEAEAVVDLLGIEVHGRPVVVRIAAATKNEAKEEERLRTVVISRCPLDTTAEELWVQFPNAEEILKSPKHGPFTGRCFLVFPTEAEAEAVAGAEELTVKGAVVRVEMIALTKEGVLESINRRTVVLSGCPPTTTKEWLWEQFPDVEDVRLTGRGKAFLVYPSLAAAQRVVASGELHILGQRVMPTIAVVDKKAFLAEQDTRTVMLSGCPTSTMEADLYALFPSLEDVRLPPQFRNTRCFLLFATPEEARATAAQNWLQLKGQRVRAEMAATNRETLRAHQSSRRVLLSGCPLSSTAADIQQLFPNVEDIHLLPRGGPFGGRCLLLFPTIEEAQAVVDAPRLELLGKPVRATMAARDTKTHQRETVTRTVVLAQCPPSASAEDLQRQFPTAEEVRMVPNGLSSKCFLQFPTREEALAVVAGRSLVTVNGEPVALRMAVSKRVADRQRADEAARTVILTLLPQYITAADLADEFPAAKAVRMSAAGRGFLVFGTPQEAEQVRSMRGLRVKGHVALAQMADNRSGEAAIKRREQRREMATRTVVLHGCPFAVTEADLQQQFSGLQSVRLPYSSRGKCFLVFDTAEMAQEVAAMPRLEVLGRAVSAEMVDPRR